MADKDDVLANPDGHTVKDVTAAMTNATPDQISETKALEAAGQQRTTILDYQPPEPVIEESRYSRERILDPFEGPLIVGHIDALGRSVKYPDLVGALHGTDAETFTPSEVRDLVDAFLTRPLAEA